MAKRDNKKVMEKANLMNDAWSEGAEAAIFSGVKQADYDNDIAAINTVDDQIDDLKLQVEMLEDKKNDMCAALEDISVKVANGVRGDVDYGPDSPLYGAMGFVRTSERKSGLTRKQKKT